MLCLQPVSAIYTPFPNVLPLHSDPIISSTPNLIGSSDLNTSSTWNAFSARLSQLLIPVSPTARISHRVSRSNQDDANMFPMVVNMSSPQTPFAISQSSQHTVPRTTSQSPESSLNSGSITPNGLDSTRELNPDANGNAPLHLTFLIAMPSAASPSYPSYKRLSTISSGSSHPSYPCSSHTPSILPDTIDTPEAENPSLKTSFELSNRAMTQSVRSSLENPTLQDEAELPYVEIGTMETMVQRVGVDALSAKDEGNR